MLQPSALLSDGRDRCEYQVFLLDECRRLSMQRIAPYGVGNRIYKGRLAVRTWAVTQDEYLLC